jgi:DnaA family protein
MHQLAFQLKSAPQPTLENFIVGQNRELLSTIGRFLCGDQNTRFIYLWGSSGAGKTHLMRASGAVMTAEGCHVCYDLKSDDVPTFDASTCFCIDNVDDLEHHEQIIFFNTYNKLRDCGGRMLVVGQQPLSNLSLRADVLTRLSWELVYQVFPLDDIQKTQAMVEYAKLCGFDVPKEVIDFILARYPRDLSSLLALLGGLDRYSLELKRGITIPLIKSFLDLKD